MSNTISFRFETFTIEAVLNGSETAKKFLDKLPVKQQVQVWGGEIYFDLPLEVGTHPDAKAEVNEGELAYWAEGGKCCLFFGTTPVSTDNKPAAIAPVNVFGTLSGDLQMLKQIKNGDTVEVSC